MATEGQRAPGSAREQVSRAPRIDPAKDSLAATFAAAAGVDVEDPGEGARDILREVVGFLMLLSSAYDDAEQTKWNGDQGEITLLAPRFQAAAYDGLARMVSMADHLVTVEMGQRQ